ncbi:MAG: efflux RND transporter permease subunit [Thermoguttaceae bacterium]
MKNFVRWVVSNSAAMNTLMFSVIVAGIFSFANMRRELFPQFDLDVIVISVPYPGAVPEEVENGICQKIEEAVADIDGIKKVNATASEGVGTVSLTLHSYVKDQQKILNEVRNAVDRIPSLPQLAENKTISLITLRSQAIQLAVVSAGNTDEPLHDRNLRYVAEEVRKRLLRYPRIKTVDITGARNYQIDIEIPEMTLRKYGMTLLDVARIVREQNIEIPGGLMRTESAEVMIRGFDKRTTGTAIEKIPVITSLDGVVLTVGDLGTVRDDFEDSTAISLINGKPGLTLTVNKTNAEDLIKITDDVKKFLRDEAPKMLPDGYSIVTVADMSTHVNDRIQLLLRNGAQGMVIVVVLLALFLELRLAFWVMLGIPISFLGGGMLLYGMDQTINMLSLFAFIMVLGILVDDAIVVGENIYHHRQLGKDFTQAAIDGACEVMPSVASAVLTTIIAFMPMFFVPGVMGRFFEIVPITVISLLAFSLFEAFFILPVHLAGHSLRDKVSWRDKVESLAPPLRPAARGLLAIAAFFAYPFQRFYAGTRYVNRVVDHLLSLFVQKVYGPATAFTLRNPVTTLAIFSCSILITIGAMMGGVIQFVESPKMDGLVLQAKVKYPDGTPAHITDAATIHLENAIKKLDAEYVAETGKSVVRTVGRQVGVLASISPMGGSGGSSSNQGQVTVELVDSAERDIPSTQILARWRSEVGKIIGVQSLTFEGMGGGPGGKMIEFKMLADGKDLAVLESAVAIVMKRLSQFEGVKDIVSDAVPGKQEFRTSIKERAKALGITNAALTNQLRASFYGAEVMRLQIDRHEVKLMVRNPPEERNSMGSFEDMKFRAGGLEIPVSELANIETARGYSVINRYDRKRSVTISADVDEHTANAANIIAELQREMRTKLLTDPKYRAVDVKWEGQHESTGETMTALLVAGGVALLAIFLLLTFEFKSVVQPLIILLIIPFSLVGAVWGHFFRGIPVTMMSMFGLVALIGVVINDSIVLIDTINRLIADGQPVVRALVEAGRRRLRPILLTSTTTIGGLMPLLLERSFQAQFLVPMAVSLCFGLLASTVLVLVFVPTLYLLYVRVWQFFGGHVEDLAASHHVFRKLSEQSQSEHEA